MKRIVLFANHTNGYNITEYLSNRKDVEIVKIIVYRNQKGMWWKSVIDLAKEKKLDYYIYTTNEALLKKLSKLEFDLILSINWRHLIPEQILNLAPMGGANFHNSLLPKFRGAYANAWAIELGLKETGVTLHWMTTEFDDGKIIAQVKVPIKNTDTARELWNRINEVFYSLFILEWPRVDTWQKKSVKQRGVPSYYSVKKYVQTNEIDLTKKMTTGDIINYLRARTFYPEYRGAYFIDKKTKKKIYLSLILTPDV
jgi:methionyl-tRNA formyltransferase